MSCRAGVGVGDGVLGEAADGADPARASDEALMARVKDRDHGAFAALVRRHLDGIHALNYRLTRNPDDAADLAQEAFLRVWNSAATWQPNRVQFSTWLYRIARNLCIDAHRRHREPAAIDVDSLDGGGAPDAAPAGERLRTALAGALAALPERQRTALVLCHHQGFSNRDAAAVLDVGVEALESLLARARRTLRATLREYRP